MGYGSDKVAKKLLLNLNRKEIKISYEGEEYIFAEPSFEEIIMLQQSESMSDAFKVIKARQLDGIDFDTLGASTQLYLMNKYFEWVTKMVNKVL